MRKDVFYESVEVRTNRSYVCNVQCIKSFWIEYRVLFLYCPLRNNLLKKMGGNPGRVPWLFVLVVGATVACWGRSLLCVTVYAL